MEPNHPQINHKPPSSLESSYFIDHLRQVAHIDPAYRGSTQLGGQIYPMVNDYHRHPIGINEATLRQIEKQKIREEIIAEEIVRRRILEAEVKRELLIERNMLMQTELDGAIYTPYLKSMMVDPKSFPNPISTQKMGESSHGERTGMPALVRHKVGSSETESQRGAEPWTSEFITPPDTVKEKEKIILQFQAKPEENISGMKRKAEVWPSFKSKQKVEVLPPVGANEVTSAVASLKKEVKEESNCAICQVTTTSEQALKEHLQGKKHKAKEAGLRKNGNNFSIGLCPKMISVPIELPEIPSSPCLEKGVNFDESMKPRIAIPAEANPEKLETNNGPVVSRSRQLIQTLKQNESPSCSKGSGKIAREKKNFTFWCEMCQVGAFCEEVMEAHRKGKKHLARLRKQNAVSDVKLVRCQKEAGEDGEGTASNVLGLVANEMEPEGNQSKFVKDVEDTTSESF